MARRGGKEPGTVRDKKKAALEETARWIDRQIEHVWYALGIEDNQIHGKLDIRQREKNVEYGFVYKGKLLAKARSYFSYEERQWRFELMEVDREYYPLVREYFNRAM